MKARLLTIVWGQPYIDWFDRACVASLEQPSNLKALRENVAVWDIVTKPEDQDVVKDIASRLGLNMEFRLDEMTTQGVLTSGDILQRELITEMHLCFKNTQAFMLIPPDSIFGEGTIETLCVLGKPRGVCIAVPHVRVKPAILDISWRMKSNAHLVAAAWQQLHRTWVESDASRKQTNTYSGGCSWRKIRDGLYAVTHLLPTIYYAQFHESDIGWWNAQIRINVWDHAWPSKVVAELRQRVVGSSDAAFIAEITPEFGNIPPCQLSDPEEPDKYWGKAAHQIFNRNSINIFRAADVSDEPTLFGAKVFQHEEETVG